MSQRVNIAAISPSPNYSWTDGREDMTWEEFLRYRRRPYAYEMTTRPRRVSRIGTTSLGRDTASYPDGRLEVLFTPSEALDLVDYLTRASHQAATTRTDFVELAIHGPNSILSVWIAR